MTIHGTMVRLRAIERGDLPAFVRWLNDPDVIRYLQRYWPLSLAEEERWFESKVQSASDRLFAVQTLDGELIGSIGLHDLDWKERRATLGIVLGEKDFWGQGYGTDAITAVLRFAFDALNLHRVHLSVYAYNQRAIRCYEKCGFELEGRLRDSHYYDGQYHDELVMGILDTDFRTKDQPRQ